jgi:hypothetical protein
MKSNISHRRKKASKTIAEKLISQRINENTISTYNINMAMAAMALMAARQWHQLMA